jgi:DNA-binding LytR/AlgR family response regulator
MRACQHEKVDDRALSDTTSLRALIADDEPGARCHLRDLLAACQVETVAECDAGEAVLAALPRVRPDLLCLDVRLPDVDGLEVARRAHADQRPAVVFTTGYADYAARAFELDAADYLIKPLSAPRVAEAVRRVRARIRLPHAMRSPSGRQPVRARLFIPAGDHHVAISPDAILYVEAHAGASLVHEADVSHRLRATLDRLERVLVPYGFLRTHRAYLVNLLRVRAFIPWSRHVHTLLLDGGKETHVPVAKSRLAAFRDSVIWIPQAGACRNGTGIAGQGGPGGRGQPRPGPGDRGRVGG